MSVEINDNNIIQFLKRLDEIEKHIANIEKLLEAQNEPSIEDKIQARRMADEFMAQVKRDDDYYESGRILSQKFNTPDLATYYDCPHCGRPSAFPDGKCVRCGKPERPVKTKKGACSPLSGPLNS